MKANALERALVCLGLTAYLFLFVLHVDGIVLCIGEDGHVELEVAVQGAACGISAPQQDAASLLSADGPGALDKRHCGACKDISLVLADTDEMAHAGALVVSPRGQTAESPLFTAPHLHSYALPILANPPKEIAPISVARPFLASVRTVILLI